MLEKWDRQRALYKEKQISTGNLTSTVSQQQMDDDLDYEEWMEQVIQRREVLMYSILYSGDSNGKIRGIQKAARHYKANFCF